MRNKAFLSIINFFKSMKFGIMLLLIILVLSVLGTIIPQGFDEHFYSLKYNAVVAKIIILFSIHNMYNSALFVGLFAALSVNLIFCSIVRLGNIIKKFKAASNFNNMKLFKTYNINISKSKDSTIQDVFREHGFELYQQSKTEANFYYSIRNKGSYFASWMLHFGILLVIIFYGYGHATYFSESVYGVSGAVETIKGTNYRAKLEDFNIEYRQDGSVQQYTSKIELQDEQGNSIKSSSVSVNNPMRYKGYTFYQTAYGWAANCEVVREGNKIVNTTIYEKTSVNISTENLAVYFNKFYPDFVATKQGFNTLSDTPQNPVILYAILYFGEVVKMDIIRPGEIVRWNEYEITLDSPQRYTYLDVNKMNGQLGAAFGTLLIMIGLILVFYFKPVKMVIKLEGDKLSVYGDGMIEKKLNLNKENLIC